VIELLDFNLRGGHDAPVAAARLANVTERYLSRTGARDLTAVVSEIVGWLTGDAPVPHALRLELSVTSAVVRVSVTAPQRVNGVDTAGSNQIIRQTLPVTAALASRYGIEANRRTRVWAEFDRLAANREPGSGYTESQYS
jgi:hypothetical protein